MNIKHIIYTICGVVIILYIVAILSMVEAQEPKVIIGTPPIEVGECIPWEQAFNTLTNAGYSEVVVNDKSVSFYGIPTEIQYRSGAMWQTFEPYIMTYWDEYDYICVGSYEQELNIRIPGAMPMFLGVE